MARFDDDIEFAGDVTFSGGQTVGSGTGSTEMNQNKSATGTADINLKAAGVLRGRLRLDASENLVLEVFDSNGDSVGSLTMANASGLVTLTDGMTVSDGTVTIAETGAPALVLSGAPEASATSAYFRLGTAIASGSALGTFIGLNAANGYAGNLMDLQVNGTSICKLTAGGALTLSDGALTIAETGAPALILSGAPEASATSSLMRMGSAIAGGSASGCYIGANAGAGYGGNFVDLQVNGSRVFRVAADGALTFGSVTLGSTAAAARSALNANILASTHYYSDIRGATAMSRQWAFGAAGFLQEVTVVLDAAIDANGSLTVTIDGNAVTFSSTTLTAAASGEGTVFRFTPTGGNTLLATSRIKVAIGGSNTNNVGAAIMCKITY